MLWTTAVCVIAEHLHFLVMASPVVLITGALSRIGHATALSNDQADCGSYTATFDTDMSEVFGSHASLS